MMMSISCRGSGEGVDEDDTGSSGVDEGVGF